VGIFSLFAAKAGAKMVIAVSLFIQNKNSIIINNQTGRKI
jgi:hypothetical protein